MISTLVNLFSLTNGCKPQLFFGLRPWYYYLQTDKNCNIINFQVLGGASGSDFLLIGLAIADDLLRLAGLVAIGYVIYGGIQYTTSQGSPEATTKAQNTIQNALVGLVIAMVAIAFVTFLGSRIADT